MAPIVKALQRGKIDMRGSCCGHGRAPGEIELQDGRMLLVLPPAEARRRLAHDEGRPIPESEIAADDVKIRRAGDMVDLRAIDGGKK